MVSENDNILNVIEGYVLKKEREANIKRLREEFYDTYSHSTDIRQAVNFLTKDIETLAVELISSYKGKVTDYELSNTVHICLTEFIDNLAECYVELRLQDKNPVISFNTSIKPLGALINSVQGTDIKSHPFYSKIESYLRKNQEIK